MKRTKDRTKATLDRTSDTTGRDGAIDLIAKVESSVILDQRDDDRFTRVMGSAVIDLWGDFPKDIQERLFERELVGAGGTLLVSLPWLRPGALVARGGHALRFDLGIKRSTPARRTTIAVKRIATA